MDEAYEKTIMDNQPKQTDTTVLITPIDDLSLENRLAMLDEALGMLIEPLNIAGNFGKVIAFTAWHPFRAFGYLPFHLHVRWPDAIHWLPVTATMSMIPDILIDHKPLYRLGDCNQARLAARRIRRSECRDLEGDLVYPDWEDGYGRHQDELREEVVGPVSFISIDRVSQNGEVTHSHRPTLGQFAARNEPRPYLLVPANRKLAESAIKRVASTDLLLADIQGLRGTHSRAIVKSTLVARGEAKPTLIIANSPSDIFALEPEAFGQQIKLYPINPPPIIKKASVTIIGRDRPLADRNFAFSTEGLNGYSAELDHILGLAKNAWWAIRQSVGGEEIEIQRFLSALEHFRQDSPFDAKSLVSCHKVILDATTDHDLQAERCQAVVDTVLGTGNTGPLLVIVRNAASGNALRIAIAEKLGVSISELSELDVVVHTHRFPPFLVTPGIVIVAGYSGLRTIDAIFASEAEYVHFVFDPVEARAMWYGARQMAEYLEERGLSQYTIPLRFLMSNLEPSLSPFTEALEMPLSLQMDSVSAESEVPQINNSERPQNAEVVVYFEDGSQLYAKKHSRFEVLHQYSGYTRIVSAEILKPGDRVIFLEDDSHALFSDRRMAALDAGPLHALAQSREEWLSIVKAIYSTQQTNLAELTRRLASVGVNVDYATVRSWISFNDLSEARTPGHWERFAIFAKAFGILLPDSQIHKYFNDIKLWRTLHRKAGRDLAYAIRSAYVNRLSACTLARIERDWGLTARQLISAATILTVDDVLVSEGGGNATLL